MAIAGEGITFFPLYWMFHDQWKYYVPTGYGGIQIFNHWGHLHFWMMGFDVTKARAASAAGDAFSGQQRFTFELNDVWGPKSPDPNQSQLYTVIGKPKWYFHVTELWRRVYVQPWDEKVEAAGVTAKRGIKYDASAMGEQGEDAAGGMNERKTMGPFREGRANHGLKNWVPYWMKGARSLPLEYFKTGNRSQAHRDNYVADRALLGDRYDDEMFNLQHGNFILAKRAGGPHAGVSPFSDALYIWPVIEYQKVVQLDWEPLPGSSPDVSNLDAADDSYGDGWGQQVTVPFTDPVTKKYRSPFAVQPGVVLPFGKYNELQFAGGRKLVPADARLRHATPEPYDVPPRPDNVPEEDWHEFDPILDPDPALAGQPLTEWHNPWGEAAGGMIVQQCLGGIVQAKAKIIIEHKLGGRHEVWTETTQYIPSTPFEGSDQAAPPPEVP